MSRPAWSGKGVLHLAFVLAAVLGAGCGVLGSREPAWPQWYLALGDSITAGTAREPVTYVAAVQQRLGEAQRPVPLTNLAEAGATTSSMIAGGQLDRAVTALRERNGTPGVITISIGGNDLARLYRECALGSTEECRQRVTTAMGQLDTHLGTVLQRLREAGGPNATIVVLTYANPLRHPQCLLSPFAALADAALEGGPPLGLDRGLNDVLRERAAAVQGRVAEAAQGVEPSGLLPDCLHPNAEGHAVIATRVMEAVDGRQRAAG